MLGRGGAFQFRYICREDIIDAFEMVSFSLFLQACEFLQVPADSTTLNVRFFEGIY